MPVRHRSSHLVRPQRRRLLWVTQEVTNQAVASAGLNQSNLLSQLEGSGLVHTGVTIMRTHTMISVDWSTSDNAPIFYFGWLVDDVNASQATLDVQNNPGAKWLMIRKFGPGVANSVIIESTTVRAGIEYDLRSKRKLGEISDRYFFAFKNTGSASANVTTYHRTLVALP